MSREEEPKMKTYIRTDLRKLVVNTKKPEQEVMDEGNEHERNWREPPSSFGHGMKLHRRRDGTIPK